MTETTIDHSHHIHTHPHPFIPEGELQPNSHMCFVCGMINIFGLKVRFFSTAPDTAEARVTFDENYQGYPGIAHGGIVATVLDEIMGRAILAADPSYRRLMFTGKMEVKYRQSVPLHTSILFRGRILKDRQRIALAEGEAILPDGTVAVEATGTLVGVPEEQLRQMDTEAVGWRVYPLED